MAMYAPLLSPLPGTLDLQSPSSTLFERSMGALVSNFKGTVGLLSTENLGSLPPPTGTPEDDNGNSASTLVNVTSSDLDANKENQHPQGESGSIVMEFFLHIDCSFETIIQLFYSKSSCL